MFRLHSLSFIPKALTVQGYQNQLLQALWKIRKASKLSTGEHTNALWISGYGRGISEDRFRKMICQRTEDEFGVKITPHFFRDSDVTTLTRDAPSSARIIGPILGHRGVDIANKHYNQSLMIDASRRHTSLLEELIENSEEI